MLGTSPDGPEEDLETVVVAPEPDPELGPGPLPDPPDAPPSSGLLELPGENGLHPSSETDNFAMPSPGGEGVLSSPGGEGVCGPLVDGGGEGDSDVELTFSVFPAPASSSSSLSSGDSLKSPSS